jgi:hypothetical protein
MVDGGPLTGSVIFTHPYSPARLWPPLLVLDVCAPV